MGAGDRYMQDKFTVPMSGKGTWPFKSKSEQRRLEEQGVADCIECGGRAIPGTAHMDKRDDDRPRRRVCMGKVIAG